METTSMTSYLPSLGRLVNFSANATNQLAWLLDELRQANTTVGEVREHFSAAYLAAKGGANAVRAGIGRAGVERAG